MASRPKVSSGRQAIGKRIEAALDGAGLGKAELARLFGKVKSAATGWVTGYSQPDLETFAKICELTGVSADEILGLPQRGPSKLPKDVVKRLISRVDEADLNHGKELDEIRAEIQKLSQ